MSRKLLKRLYELQEDCAALAELPVERSDLGTWFTGDAARHASSFRQRLHSTFERLYGLEASETKLLKARFQYPDSNLSEETHRARIAGQIDAAIDDIESGYLHNVRVLVAAEVLDDLLEQARELLDAGHLRPAAVVGRVALEDVLRRLAREEDEVDAQTAGDRFRKASQLNIDLCKTAGRYNQPRMKRVDAALDVGNDAAHPDSTVDEEQVEKMIDDVIDFMAAELS